MKTQGIRNRDIHIRSVVPEGQQQLVQRAVQAENNTEIQPVNQEPEEIVTTENYLICEN